MTSYTIGIDLGTSFCCAGIFIDNKVCFLNINKNKNYIMPSCVAFDDTNNILIGESAKNQIEKNPDNTIYNIKRLIGRKYSDPDVQKNLNNYKYNIISKDDEIYISTFMNGKQLLLTPEEITSLILNEIKLYAEKYINQNIKNAVITVPAYFNYRQRQATIDSANMAGLNVLKIISEPVAASIGYGFEKDNINKNILVYDLGAGTLDVTLLNIHNNTYNIKAISGNTSFGGEDFTQNLLAHYIADIKSKFDIDLFMDSHKQKFIILKNTCEQIKIALSNQLDISININNFINNLDYLCEMNRNKFESICQDLFDKALDPVKQVLNDSNMFRIFINEIVLVGGSSRIPKIRSMLSAYFGNRKINISIDPDKVVAYGATIQSHLLSGSNDTLDLSKRIELLDIVPLSMGINSNNGKMNQIIKRNTKIPCRFTKVFSTNIDNQQNMLIKIYQGERILSNDCHFIGDCVFDDISIGKKNSVFVEITFNIDINGLLHVYANDKIKNNKQKINIKYDINKLSHFDIINLINDANKHADNDIEILKNLDATSSYNNILEYAKEIITDNEIKIILNSDSKSNSEFDPINITNIIDNEIKWLNSTLRTHLEINSRNNDIREKFFNIPSYNIIIPIILIKIQQIEENKKLINLFTDSVLTEYITEPILTEPILTEPILTEPILTEPILTEPILT